MYLARGRCRVDAIGRVAAVLHEHVQLACSSGAGPADSLNRMLLCRSPIWVEVPVADEAAVYGDGGARRSHCQSHCRSHCQSHFRRNHCQSHRQVRVQVGVFALRRRRLVVAG